MSVESVRAEIAAAMGNPNIAERLQTVSAARLAPAPANTPLPFVLHDGPLYKIR